MSRQTSAAQSAPAGEREAFSREDRYTVIKHKDLSGVPRELLVELRLVLDRLGEFTPERKYVVVEDDWPEYEPVWAMIEARMTTAAPATPAAQGAVPDAQAAPVGEREALSAFTAWGESVGLSPALQTVGELKAFEAGAEWQARAALAQSERVPEAVRDALARRCLWLAFCWNDHNFGPAHEEARKEALKHGIDSFEAANEWLAAAPAHQAERQAQGEVQGLSAWIACCDDQLPPEDQQVLCWCDDGGMTFVEVASQHNGFFTDCFHELLPVTHWMPLPAAPEGGEV